MGSFVPFGGFFSSPSECKSPLSCTNQSFTRCHSCDQKYEQEVADILKVGPVTSACGSHTSLPWLQKASVEIDQGLDVEKVCVMITKIRFLYNACKIMNSLILNIVRKTQNDYSVVDPLGANCCTNGEPARFFWGHPL